MDRNWRRDHRYTSPNLETYPWMWMWDSCFHAIIYGALEDERATQELESVFRFQTDDGMVPHMGYQLDESQGVSDWGADGGSTITQPPMYGHAIAELKRRGFQVEGLIERGRRGIQFLLDQRRLECGLLGIAHPWETGADDSPRWLAISGQPTNSAAWKRWKSKAVDGVIVTSAGSSLGNRLFSVAPASFNALVAFNAVELGWVSGDRVLVEQGEELARNLEARFNEKYQTWPDVDGVGQPISTIRTLDSLLMTLNGSSKARFSEVAPLILSGEAFGFPFGPAGVHQREPAFDPTGYWRGAAWPQLTYLFWLAFRQQADLVGTQALRKRAIDAAWASDFAEYHDPRTGEGYGAIPQSWAGLCIAM